MAIRSKISSEELTKQVTDSYIGDVFEVALVSSPGTSYQPGFTSDATFISSEVAQSGGYRRQTLSFAPGDVSTYSDGGVALATKAAVFAHDGSGGSWTFSHVVLLRGQGNVQQVTSVPVSKPSAGINGQYESLPTITTGSGYGLTLNLTTTNSGVAITDWTVAIDKPGYGYQDGDSISITDPVLTAAGVIPSGAGPLVLSIEGVTAGGGAFVSVAPASNAVVMNNGNEAVFYFNLKQFGQG